MKKSTFWVILYDDDQKLFNIIGPVSDDTEITNKTVDLQRLKKNVRISTIGTSRFSKETLISQGMKDYKYDPTLIW